MISSSILICSIFHQASLPPWNISSPFSPCMSPVSSTILARAEGNQRALKNTSSARLASSGSKSLGRAGAGAFLRQGDAGLSPPPGSREWDPELDAKAPTLSRTQSGRGSIKRPALTKAALMRLAAGEKKVEEEERRRQKSEFGIEPLLRSRAVTPSSSNSLMTRSAYGVGSSLAAGETGHLQADPRRCRTPQPSRRRSNSRRREHLENDVHYSIGNSMNYNNKHQSTSWRSFQPVMAGESAFHGRPHLAPHLAQSPPPMDRAEPDGVEDDKESQGAVAKSLEGDYDHSKEYDPFKTAERQMQELLFGSPTATKPRPSYGSAEVTHQSVQKPQPLRPGPSNPNPYNLKVTASNPNSSLHNLKTTARGLATSHDHPSISDGPTNPSRGHSHIKPTHPNLSQRGPAARMCRSPENEVGASREKKTNWRQFLPALLSRQQTNLCRQQTNTNSKQQAQKSFLTATSTNKQTSSGLAR